MRLLLPLLLLFLLTASCQKEKPRDPFSFRAFPIEYDSSIKEKALNYSNVLTGWDTPPPELTALGEKLFFDTRLSGNQTQSCNTCHPLHSFGMDNKPLSEGAKGGVLKRNTPTVLNAALHFRQFWDGRVHTLEEQVAASVLDSLEMAMPSRSEVEARLRLDPEYGELFAKAFPDIPEPVTFEAVTRAIAAFERTLITPARFDQFLLGAEDALNGQEKRGLSLFVDLGCIKCHSGPALGGNIYQKFGLVGYYWDHTKSKKIDSGLFEITRNPLDKYVFKVPALRNVEKTAPYFHDGSVLTLQEAIQVMAKTQTGQDLSPSEIEDIEAFLKTLTGPLFEI